MKKETNVAKYVFSTISATEVVVADQPITVREADRAAQELRKAYIATLA